MANRTKKSTRAKTKRATSKPNPAQENLKKLFLAGLGLADETNEKLHETFNSLVKRGKIKQPQVRKAVNDIQKRVLSRRKELEKKFNEFFKQNDLIKSKDVQSLFKKVEFLEKKTVTRLKKATSPRKTSSKVVATKKSRSKPSKASQQVR